MERPGTPGRPIDVDENRTLIRNGVLAVVLFLAVGAVLTSSARGGQHRAAVGPPVPGTLVATVRRAAPDPAAPVATVAQGATNLGYRLEQLTAAPGRNWVASPWSMAEAFGMLRVGARGDTAAQIDRVFGFPAHGRDPALNTAGQRLAAGPVHVANGLFLQHGFAVGGPFLRTLGTDYGAGVHTVDFGSPAALPAVNGWVRAQTAGRIDHLFDGLDASTRLVLVNAVVLRADWKYPFEHGETGKVPFTRGDGRVEQVTTMRQENELRYAGGAGWDAVELPYKNSDLAMLVLVPAAGADPAALLRPETMSAARAGLHPESLAVQLPRWDFDTSLDLSDPLVRLGMPDAFSDRADLSGIAPGLSVAQAVHRANITVDEKGTTAAAATGIAVASSARLVTRTVRADHPFAFAIVDRSAGLPLFEGVVADPGTR